MSGNQRNFVICEVDQHQLQEISVPCQGKITLIQKCDDCIVLNGGCVWLCADVFVVKPVNITVQKGADTSFICRAHPNLTSSSYLWGYTLIGHTSETMFDVANNPHKSTSPYLKVAAATERYYNWYCIIVTVVCLLSMMFQLESGT